MDGSQGVDPIEYEPAVLPILRNLIGLAGGPHEGLIERRLDAQQSLVATKLVAGFDDDCVAALRRILEDVSAGRRGQLKFLVLDFAHHMERDSEGGEGFNRLVNELASLILRAPIISVACVRADLSGADLELALACNVMIAETGRRFSFAGDPVASLATYGFLSQKIGFARAERLMESGESIDTQQMSELLLVKAMLEPNAGFAGIEQFLARSLRRHNSAYGIYRAQRIASPAIFQALGEARSA
jgi:enoyl-CoA hydratase/carnithine racemase